MATQERTNESSDENSVHHVPVFVHVEDQTDEPVSEPEPEPQNNETVSAEPNDMGSTHEQPDNDENSHLIPVVPIQESTTKRDMASEPVTEISRPHEPENPISQTELRHIMRGHEILAEDTTDGNFVPDFRTEIEDPEHHDDDYHFVNEDATYLEPSTNKDRKLDNNLEHFDPVVATTSEGPSVETTTMRLLSDEKLNQAGVIKVVIPEAEVFTTTTPEAATSPALNAVEEEVTRNGATEELQTDLPPAGVLDQVISTTSESSNPSSSSDVFTDHEVLLNSTQSSNSLVPEESTEVPHPPIQAFKQDIEMSSMTTTESSNSSLAGEMFHQESPPSGNNSSSLTVESSMTASTTTETSRQIDEDFKQNQTLSENEHALNQTHQQYQTEQATIEHNMSPFLPEIENEHEHLLRHHFLLNDTEANETKPGSLDNDQLNHTNPFDPHPTDTTALGVIPLTNEDNEIGEEVHHPAAEAATTVKMENGSSTPTPSILVGSLDENRTEDEENVTLPPEVFNNVHSNSFFEKDLREDKAAIALEPAITTTIPTASSSPKITSEAPTTEDEISSTTIAASPANTSNSIEPQSSTEDLVAMETTTNNMAEGDLTIMHQDTATILAIPNESMNETTKEDANAIDSMEATTKTIEESMELAMNNSTEANMESMKPAAIDNVNETTEVVLNGSTESMQETTEVPMESSTEANTEVMETVALGNATKTPNEAMNTSTETVTESMENSTEAILETAAISGITENTGAVASPTSSGNETGVKDEYKVREFSAADVTTTETLFVTPKPTPIVPVEPIEADEDLSVAPLESFNSISAEDQSVMDKFRPLPETSSERNEVEGSSPTYERIDSKDLFNSNLKEQVDSASNETTIQSEPEELNSTLASPNEIKPVTEDFSIFSFARFVFFVKQGRLLVRQSAISE